MNRPEATEPDLYFQRLQDRHRRYAMRRLKASLEHAGYKGTALMHTLYHYTCLYNIINSTPRLCEIIGAFDSAYAFDTRTAVSQAVEAARSLDFQGLEQLATAGLVEGDESYQFSEETHSLWLHTVRLFEKEHATHKNGATAAEPRMLIPKLLLRYAALKAFIKNFSPHFTEERMAAEAATVFALDEEELQNEAVVAIGKRVFPELFMPGFVSGAKEPQEPQPQQKVQQPAKELKRIEWLGTQAQLAELFIELERKGWIREKITETVQACFTNADSIDQPFRPYKDEFTGEATYSKVFTGKYTAQFKGMREKKKYSR